MTQFARLITALAIVLSGAVLIPFISLPAQAFSWQIFADAYSGGPTLKINHDSGKPGSFFEIKGQDFPANAQVAISINSKPLGSVTSDAFGGFEFELDTATNGAGEGYYFVSGTVNPSATVRFTLDGNAPGPPWLSVGAKQTFAVPQGIALDKILFFPVLFR